LADQIVIHSRNLTDEFQTDLNNHCDVLAQKKLHIEDNMKHKVNLSCVSLKLFCTHI